MMRASLTAALSLALALGAVLPGSPAPAQAAADLHSSGPSAAGDSLARGWRGRSGALRAVVLPPLAALDLAAPAAAQPGAAGYRWTPLFASAAPAPGQRLLGEPVGAPAAAALPHAPAEAGVWRVDPDRAYASDFGGPEAPAVITLVPFAAIRGGRLNGYHIGRYPAEGSGRTDRYAPPSGFIEVTRENQDFQISEHFRLRQFLTKDQFDVWPKYLALDLRLIDKLELVLQELNAMGVRADRVHVMSGFRTPQYNGPGGDGRARLSRHTYGDAADVWVDNDGNGYIDDLNGDGRADVRDAEVILRAVDRVEQRHPELVGGAGVYDANSAHGPFIHIDVRGTRSRW